MYIWEELLLADSLEKIIRMEFYLEAVDLRASEDEIKIVEFYNNTLQTIKNQLEESANWLKKYHGGKINDEISKLCINNCLDVSMSIWGLHDEFLQYLPSLNTRVETYTFLKNMLQQTFDMDSEDITPAIVLIDAIYDYHERNISQALKENGIVKGEIEEQIIIGLPKIEKDNPLMWAILVHEIGHVLIKKNLKDFNNIVIGRLKENNIKTDHLSILIRWIEEITCDTLAIRIMGPSYLYSYLFNNLSNDNLNGFSESHPSPSHRISIMISILEEKGFKLSCMKELYHIMCQRQLPILNSGYLFSWNDIPGNDNEKLIGFLKHELTTARIEKINDGKIIRIFFENNSISLELNDEKTKVNLKINDVVTDELIVNQKNDRLNIYNSGDALCPMCETKLASSSDIDEIKKDFRLSINISRDLSDAIKTEDYTPQKLNDCEKLVYNLKNSIPISSSRKMDDKELKAIFLQNKSARFNNKKIDIYPLLEQFEDKPNSVSDIINAGWLHKVNNSYSEFIRLFFENNDEGNNTFDDRYDNYKKFLYKSDELLLKSLEISDMHSLLEYGRNLL